MRRSLHAAGLPTRDAGQTEGIRRRQVRQGILFEVGPQGLDGIQFRGIRGEKHSDDASLGEKLLHAAGPVAGQPIPNQQDRAAQGVGQMAQEVDQPSGGDVGVGAQGKVQSDAPAPGRYRQRRDTGDFFAGTSALIQHGRPSPGRPTAPDQRRQQQAAFVQKDQRGVQALGVFFTCGQTVRTQRRMACSSRSRARRAGFCGLQPKAWSRRPR